MSPSAAPPSPTVGRALSAIRAAIADANGWIPFSRYMELALFAPGAGYYSADDRQFGRAGDFVTASGISRLFGATLARQVVEICERSAPRVLEFGAGTGDLAADILLAARNTVDEYVILEVSPHLRQRQAQTLAARAASLSGRVRWIDRLPDKFAGCMLANEVLDAMPVELVHWGESGIARRGVAWEGETLRFADRPALSELELEARRLREACDIRAPYTSEIGLAGQAWMATLARILDRGAVLAIDYGFPAREYYHPQRSAGTLMGHQHHQAVTDPLHRPGDIDLTAHVDFSAIADAASDAGLDVLGYAPQAGFLIDCGILDLLAQTPPEATATYLPLTNQVNRLLSPAEMGELFKVFAAGRGVGDSLSGFARSDRRHAL
jgi:SAM-dependent MidA family methyltransferase